MSRLSFPENFKLVEGIANLTDGGARTADYVSLKNIRRATAIVTILGGAATAMDLNPYQATNVAADDEKVFVKVLRWWMNASTGVTDTLVAQTAAIDGNTAATSVNKMVVFQFDPTDLDVANNFDCITIKTEGDEASNLLSIIWILETDYEQATPPTAITD